ncbi:MAG: DUF5916 domain-containing protein [Rhodothermales bacterium]
MLALFLALLSLIPFGPKTDTKAPPEDDVYAPERVERAEVNVDGHLDEDLWRTTLPLTSWYQQSPNEGAAPSEVTEAWLVYDDEAIYFAARLHEADPGAITTRTMERDSYSPDQDAVAVILDTSNDDRTAFAFIVTPAGVRTDLAVANDAEGAERSWNFDWNTFWDAAVVRQGDGWDVEMRIPFSNLRFTPGADGGVEMGLILWRYLARNVEFTVFPEIPNLWDASAYKPSRALSVRFEGPQPKNPLYVKPYVLGGVDQESAFRTSEERYAFDSEMRRDVGLDVKYNITSNLVLDVTANTDFAQVEADDEQVNLTRFSLFFPEKRDFFQERADLFEFRLPGGDQRLFQSRRIGIVGGQSVPILGGARLTGQVGGWELGVLNMQTAQAQLGGLDTLDTEVPSENFGVLRLQRPVLDQGSYVGGLVTSRVDADGYYNVLSAIDADLRLWGADYLEIKLAHSAEAQSRFGQSLLAAIVLRRRIRRGFNFGLSAQSIGPDFRPGVGYLIREGIARYGQRLGYAWFPGTSSPIQNHELIHRAEFIFDKEQSWLETHTQTLAWEALFRSGASVELGAEVARERLLNGFFVGDVAIPPGLYYFGGGEARYITPTGAPLRLEAALLGGGYFGGTRAGAELAPIWSPSPYFSLGMDYLYDRVDVPDGVFTAHVARLRVGAALNRTLSASAFVQYNSSSNLVTPNVRLRYNPTEGSDLYIVYNEGVLTDRLPSDPILPRLPRTQARQILLKYTYTFAL